LAPVTTWLLDTGPLVAYLDSSDPWHEAVTERLDPFCGQLVTSSAVITEAMHLVAEVRTGPRLLAEYVAAAGMRVFDACSAPDLRDAVALMEKYSIVPMDFADATLVLLAEALDLRDVLTLDRRGFATYRTRQRRAFNLVLAPR
jgi:hypothetical protein